METYNSTQENVWTGESSVSDNLQMVLNDLYADKRPVVGEDDTYIFISMDVCVDGDNMTGILNCRLNGSQQQIRF